MDFQRASLKLSFPIANATRTAFLCNSNLNISHHTDPSFQNAIKTDVENAFGILKDIVQDLDFLPKGGGYAGERYVGPPHLNSDQNQTPFLESFNAEWMPHVASYMSWEKGYSIAIVCDTYRRLTCPEFQTPEHMHLVYILGLAADMLTNRAVIFDDLLDGNNMRNQKEAYHTAHPKSYMNDGILMGQMAHLLLKKYIPDHHPAKEEMLAKSLMYDHHTTYYFLYNSKVLRGIQHIAIAKFPPSPGSQEKLAGNPEEIPLKKMGINTYYEFQWFRAYCFLRYLMDLGRLAACYYSPELDLDTYYRTIDLAITVGCLTDDLLDYNYKQIVEDIRSGEFGSHIAILLEIVNHGYPDHILGEEFRAIVPSTTKEINKIQSILQQHFATGKEEDAVKILDLFNKFNVKIMIGAWLESELRELDKLINSTKGQQMNTAWIRGTVLDIGIAWQLENNVNGSEADKEMVLKIKNEYGNSSRYFKTLILALVTAAKKHNANT